MQDTYHAQTLDGNMTVFLRNNFEYIGVTHMVALVGHYRSCTYFRPGHVQISQVPGRHEPNENGEINFPFFFKSLASLGYDGWLGCEYIPTGKEYLIVMSQLITIALQGLLKRA